MKVDIPAADGARTRALWRDLAAGLRQQMYFLGRDVLHPSGNLLLRSGFLKRPSEGLKGTSCYRLPWEGGFIDLHGSCAGWYPDAEGPGFIYVRPRSRCFRWMGDAPPVPGKWPVRLLRADDTAALHAAALPFLSWWLAYERAIITAGHGGHRGDCYRGLRRAAGLRQWLPPSEAIGWVEQFRTDLPRLRRPLQAA